MAENFANTVGSSLHLHFVTQGAGDLQETFGPEDLLHYIYAILQSRNYRRRFADFLRSDFPRIPVTSDRNLFVTLARFGQRLSSLHLLETETDGGPSFPEHGSNRVDAVQYESPSHQRPGRVYINREQFFEGISPETWTYTVGGYQPADRWLKDRKGRDLGYEDVNRYSLICAAICETNELMKQIDQVIEDHGGWPLR